MSTYMGDAGNSRVSLSSVLVGTVIAMGLMVLFTLLGMAIGAASLDAAGQGLGIGAAIYLVITQLISLAAGAFAASRLLNTYDAPAAIMAGVSVWALTTLIVAFGGIGAGKSAINTSAGLVSQVAQGAGSAVQAVTPDDISLPDISEIAGNVSLSDLPPEVQQALEEADVTPEDLRAELGEAFRNVISQQEMARARSILSSTVSDVIANPSSFEEEINAAIDQLVGGDNAVLSEEDLAQATNTLQRRLDISDAQAQQLADSVRSRFDTAVETLRQTAADLQQRLVTAADRVQSAVATSALWLFIASLLGLAAAAGAGFFGRRS